MTNNEENTKRFALNLVGTGIVKEVMKDYKVTQKDLMEKSKIDQSTVSVYLLGRGAPIQFWKLVYETLNRDSRLRFLDDLGNRESNYWKSFTGPGFNGLLGENSKLVSFYQRIEDIYSKLDNPLTISELIGDLEKLVSKYEKNEQRK